jgi:hypothetical protein
MSYDLTTGQWQVDELLEKLKAEKHAGNELQMRKHTDWNDNYDLYRGIVKTNRLTQRQAVCVPLMKETIKTILSKNDEAPTVNWKELAGNEDKEILYQEIWDMGAKENKLDLVDILDKKSVFLYGISTRKLNIGSAGISIDALDPYDVVFDPLMKVGQIESARFVVHQNIFRSVREILASDRYSQKGKDDLMIWLNSPIGITQSEEDKKQWMEKMKRLKDMGVGNKDFPLFAGGDRIVSLTEHFTTAWDEEKKDWVRRVVTYADDSVELSNVTLMEAIGADFWPFVTWTEDPESTDIYSDSIADLVRTPNKIINVWYSQIIENRSLKNFQMHWFSPNGNYLPQTYTPGPGVMLPAPPGDDINKVIKPVEISGLEDTMAAIDWITQIVERGTGATAIEKGEPEKGVQTLGEVQILVGKAMERSIGIRKFYTMAYYELCMKWSKMLDANAPKIIKLYKTGRSGKMYTKKVFQSDWQSEEGYDAVIGSSSEQEQNEVKTIQKWQFVIQGHPNNLALKSIALKRELELLDLSPDELKQVEEAEKAAAEAAVAPTVTPGAPNGAAPDMNAIQDKISKLSSMVA